MAARKSRVRAKRATGNDGLAEFPVPENNRPVNQAFALVSMDGRPGITSVYPAQRDQQPEGMWRLYVVPIVRRIVRTKRCIGK